MAHIQPATHEAKGHLYYHPARHHRYDGLAPYWALTSLLVDAFDGHGEAVLETGGETWHVDLAYHQSGIAPRPQDDVGGDRLYELDVHLDGRDRRKVHFTVKPRFPEMRHYESGEEITAPFDHLDADEGVAVQFQAANVDLEEAPGLLREALSALFAAGGSDLNRRYFRQPQGGRISEIERYVRIRRESSRKLTRRDGLFHRLAHLLSQTEGTKGEHKWDNTEAVGYIHQLRAERGDWRNLIPTHGYGRQLKCYLPESPGAFEESDALYHPKFGALFRKSLHKGHSVPWDDRDQLVDQLDETLVNCLRWADIPTTVGEDSDAADGESGGGANGTFVPDDHFAVVARDESVPTCPDPTPDLKAEQEHLLVTALRDMTASDVEIVETVATDGRGHVEDVADAADVAVSTVYRCLQRVEDVLESRDGMVRFMSQKVREEIRAIVESTEHRIESAADRVAQLYNVDVRQSASSAVSKFLAEYGAEYVPPEDKHDRHRIRFDTYLSELKSSSFPYIGAVVQELVDAWHTNGRGDLVSADDLYLEYESDGETVMKRVAALR